jgi:hypothetical protein
MAYDPRGGDRGGDHGGDGTGFVKARGRRPVTDYGATMVHWIRDRRPRYQGSFKGEAERPSASYIVDVGKSRGYDSFIVVNISLITSSDAPSVGQSDKPSRLGPCKASAFISQQDKTPR